MAFSATLSGVTIGASITNVSLYPCTSSTSGDCSGTVIPNYSNVAKSSLSPSLTVNDIPNGTTHIKLVASGGGCTPDLILPISNIPGAATFTPTPSPAATLTPTATPTATSSAPAPPTPSPTPSATPAFKTIVISNPQTTVEGACGVSSGLTKYISSAYSNITNGIVVYNESSLTNKYLPSGDNTGGYWPIIFGGQTFAVTFAPSDEGAISTKVDCATPLTFSATTDSSTYGEYENEINGNNKVTVTVRTSRSAVGSYIWWAKHSGTADYSDFKNDHTSPMLISNATGHTFILVIDNIAEVTEGSETFSVGILTGTTSPPTAGGEVAYTPTFTIADDSIPPQYRYALLERVRNYEGCPDNSDVTGDQNYYWDQFTNESLDGSLYIYTGTYCYRYVSGTNDENIKGGKSEISTNDFRSSCPSCT